MDAFHSSSGSTICPYCFATVRIEGNSAVTKHSGFYFLLSLLAICLTVLIFGLGWFSKIIYYVASGGDTMHDYTMPIRWWVHTRTRIFQ